MLTFNKENGMSNKPKKKGNAQKHKGPKDKPVSVYRGQGK